MQIKTLTELREALNYEQRRIFGKQPIAGILGWMKADFQFWFHPGNPTKFMYCLRCEEYFSNRRGGGTKLILLFLRIKHKKLQAVTGIELRPFCADIGVTINHGKCVVSQGAKIGRDSVILSDVTIGGTGGDRDCGAAKIGERCFISSGARIIGDITIADKVVVGANAVVTKSITEPGITVAGVPAKKINSQGSDAYITRPNH